MPNVKTHVSNLDEEKTQKVGGTGIALNDSKHIIIPEPRTRNFSSLCGEGRVGMYALNLGPNICPIFYVLYGYINGDSNPEARERTNDICDIIFEEIYAQDKGPYFIVGDFNATISKLQSLQNAILNGEVIDVGAQASVFGGLNSQETCKAKPDSIGTRKDYVLASPSAYDLIHSFKVDDNALLKVHDVLQLELKVQMPETWYDKVCMPTSINQVFYGKCKQLYGEQNCKDQKEKQAEQQSKKKEAAIKVEIDLPQGAEGISSMQYPASQKDSKPSIKQAIQELQEEQDEDEDDYLSTIFTKQQITEQKADMHLCIDKHLASKGLEQDWDLLLASHNTDQYVINLASAIEGGVSEYAKLDKREHKQFQGRATINVERVKHSYSSVHVQETNSVNSNLYKNASRLLLQHRRLIAIRNCSQKMQKRAIKDDPLQRHRINKELQDNINACIKNMHEDDKQDELKEHILEHILDSNINYFKITLEAEKLLNEYKQLSNLKTKSDKQRAKSANKYKLQHKAISRRLKGAQPAPLTCLRRPTDKGDNKKKGTLTTNHDELDGICHEVWGNITDGTKENLDKITNDFMINYEEFIHRGKPLEVGVIEFEAFKQLCLKGGDSAPGLDGWSNKDLALLSDQAIKLIVNLLNAIELGAPWPKAMQEARAVFLSKEPTCTTNPLNYRVLKITSTIYRKWGTYRNATLQPWVDTWIDKAHNSGAAGKGAQDAWYHTALWNEVRALTGEDVPGGSIDIYKCFD